MSATEWRAPSKDSKILRVARQQRHLVGLALGVGQRDLVAGAFDRVAVLVLALVLGAELLALDRPLALGLVAAIEEGRGAVLVVELVGHLAVVLAGQRVADQRHAAFGAAHPLATAPYRRRCRRPQT